MPNILGLARYRLEHKAVWRMLPPPGEVSGMCAHPTGKGVGEVSPLASLLPKARKDHPTLALSGSPGLRQAGTGGAADTGRHLEQFHVHLNTLYICIFFKQKPSACKSRNRVTRRERTSFPPVLKKFGQETHLRLSKCHLCGCRVLSGSQASSPCAANTDTTASSLS